MLFRTPEADQREAREAASFGLFFPSEEGFDFGLVLTCGTGQTADPRPTGGASHRSCGVPGVEALEELALSVLHIQSSFGIGLGLGNAIQFRKCDVWP